MTKATRGRPRSGSLDIRKRADGGVTIWGRVRLSDGTRSGVIPAPDGMTVPQARRWILALQAREDVEHVVYRAKVERERALAAETKQAHPSETVDAWFRRHLAAKECGEGHRQTSGFRWGKHVSPIIGHLPIATLTRDQIEGVRDYLDTAIDGGMSGASARNVWSLVTSAMKDACAAKDRTLRVHSAPLHVGILPPKRTRARRRPWLYPSEAAALYRCEAVPLEARRLYALAIGLALRPGELQALLWSDISTEARSVTVSKAWDHAAQKVGPPKTEAGQRTFPIHPSLLPLLAAMRGEPDEPVIARTDADRIAGQFRAHLRLAGVDRVALFAKTATTEPVDFRSCRDTGATWQALEGVPVTVLRRRLGHQSLETSDAYCKAAESIDGQGLGRPVPALDALLPEGFTHTFHQQGEVTSVIPNTYERRGWDSNLGNHEISGTYPDSSIPVDPRNTGNGEGANPTLANNWPTGNDPLAATLRAGLEAIIREAIRAELARRGASR